MRAGGLPALPGCSTPLLTLLLLSLGQQSGDCLKPACRTKEQQIQEWMETASVSSRGTDVAEKEASRARESARRLEAEVQRLSTHLSQAQAAARSAALPDMQPALVLTCPCNVTVSRTPASCRARAAVLGRQISVPTSWHQEISATHAAATGCAAI